MRENRVVASPQLTEGYPCCLSATNRNLRKLFPQVQRVRYYFFPLSFLESRNKIQGV